MFPGFVVGVPVCPVPVVPVGAPVLPVGVPVLPVGVPVVPVGVPVVPVGAPVVPVGAPVLGLVVGGMLLPVPVVPVGPVGDPNNTYHWLLTSSHAVRVLASLLKLEAKALAKFAVVGRSALALEFELQVVLAVVAPAHTELASITTNA